MSELFRRPAGAPPLIFGHRGCDEAPENTLAAFERALDQGADGVELDARLCGSGELVVFHDVDLGRVSGGSDRRAIHLLSYRELQAIDLGSGQRIPRLSEVLRWARARRARVNVEVKGDAPGHLPLARAVARAVAGVPDAERYLLLSSFYPGLLLAVGALGCRLPMAGLFHRGQARLRPWEVGRALGLAALHPERTLTPPGAVRRARAAGLIVNVWTVDDEAEARDLAALGVDGLISNRPGAIRAALSGGP